MTTTPKYRAVCDGPRARGALLGLAVGDAFGTTVELSDPGALPFAPLLAGPHVELVGGGPFSLAAGRVTDDTQLAACLATSLACNGGALDVDDVLDRYLAWRPAAFDVGVQIGAVLNLVNAGIARQDAGVVVWRDRQRTPAGNGSLMRTAPIGVVFATRRDQLVDAAMRESAITHADPRCQLACAAFDTAIASAVAPGGSNVGRAMLLAAQDGLIEAAERLTARWSDETELIAEARRSLERDLEAAQEDDPDLYGEHLHLLHHAGFVRVAFRLAFWHLLHTRSWRDAMVDIANRGGDADTNAAVAGALLGARDGEAALPEAWRRQVLGALAGDTGAMATTYHPDRLLELVEP